MTFGEHLGELRNCLLRSIYGLVGGFIVGLLVGGHVVSFIQRPLSHALTTYYQRESSERVQRELEKLDPRQMEQMVQAELEKAKKSGLASSLTPEEAKARVEAEVKRRVEAEVNSRVVEEHLLADEVFINPAQVLRELKNAYPEQFKNVPPLPEIAIVRRERPEKHGSLVPLASQRG